MADHQQAAAPRQQLIHQTLALRTIQVIAGLVQNQNIRLVHKRSGERHAHRFAAAQLRGRCMRIASTQALPFQFGGKLRMRTPALADTFKIGGRNTASGNAVQGIQQRRDTGQLGNALPRRNAHPLRQVVHAPAAHAPPGTGEQLTGQQARKYALAHAIAPDQTSSALVDMDVQIGK